MTEPNPKGTKLVPLDSFVPIQKNETNRSLPYQIEAPLWRVWMERLPRKLYCTDYLNHGLIIRQRKAALRFAYIQFDPPFLRYWIVLDLDYKDSSEAWERHDLPAPNIICENPANGHAHYYYGLTKPVSTGSLSRTKPIKYLAAIERGLTLRLRADSGYAGVVAKNPISERWRTSWSAIFPYSLNELEGWLTPGEMRRPPKPQQQIGIGRNCSLFDDLRGYAYSAVLRFKSERLPPDLFFEHLVGHANALNQSFCTPLRYSEVRCIARSVSKWTWRNFSPEEFSEIQSARRSSLKCKRAAILNGIDPIHREAMSTEDIAEHLNCSRRTARRYRSELTTTDCTTITEQAPWKAEGISRATWYRRQKQKREAQ
ncbi:MAG: replication initiation protein [Filomicrobium sp.]